MTRQVGIDGLIEVPKFAVRNWMHSSSFDFRMPTYNAIQRNITVLLATKSQHIVGHPTVLTCLCYLLPLLKPDCIRYFAESAR